LDSLEGNGAYRRRLVEEADQVAWLLGINFTIQLIPGAGDQILQVVAGQSEAVRRRGRQLYEEAWSQPVHGRASLIVAAIEGAAPQQTWENFGRALGAATALVEDGGAIAVCCDLDTVPGPALRQLAGSRSRTAAMRRIDENPPNDALPAGELARALDRGKVYLLSRLDPAVVEELDMIPVGDGQELARLSRRYHSCIVLSNAPNSMVTVLEDGLS
jgi:hypothetical protein